MILGLGFLTMMFNGIKYGVIAYYFTHYVGKATLAGWYFIVLLLISIFAALVAGYLTRLMGRKTLFITSLLISGVRSEERRVGKEYRCSGSAEHERSEQRENK